MKFRTVDLVGSIDSKKIDELSDRLLILQMQSNDPIKLVINSPGGAKHAAMVLHDIIYYTLRAPVHAIVIGQCSSAATFVLLACPVRLAMPSAEFVVHSGTFAGISITANDLHLSKAPRILDEMRKEAKSALDFYVEKLKMPEAEVQQLISRGDEQFNNSMNAVEALNIGLITGIVKENVGIFPDPNASS